MGQDRLNMTEWEGVVCTSFILLDELESELSRWLWWLIGRFVAFNLKGREWMSECIFLCWCCSNACDTSLLWSVWSANRCGHFEMQIVVVSGHFEMSFISFIHSGYFYSASSGSLLLRGAPDYSIDTVSELTHRSATGNCEWRTCPRSLRGSEILIGTCDLQYARHQTSLWTTTPHRLFW